MSFKIVKGREMDNYRILRIGNLDYVVPKDELSKLRAGETQHFQEVYRLVDFEAGKMLLAEITSPSKIEQITQRWMEVDVAEVPRGDTREAMREARERDKE